jgi:hypothetical protein
VWRVAHRGNILDELISAALQMAERFEALAAQVGRMESTVLERETRMAFAAQAAEIRYPDGKPSGLDPGKLLIPRRAEDVGNDAWRTLNVVQEHLLRGGIRLTEEGTRRRSTRGLSSIRQNVRVNTALWEAAAALVA